MINTLREFIRKPENFSYILTILIAIVVAILGFLEIASVEILIAAVALVLGAITSVLVVFHGSVRRFQQEVESPGLGKVFRPFRDLEDDMHLRNMIKAADEIWLLARTGQGIVGMTFNEEFETAIKRVRKCGAIRFLFLDPQEEKNTALRMVANVQNKLASGIGWIHRSNSSDAERYLNQLKTNYDKKIDLRVIDYLPAWTLLIINPNKTKNSVAYVELATYKSHHKTRPTLKVTPNETEYYSMFLDEFIEMSAAARPW